MKFLFIGSSHIAFMVWMFMRGYQFSLAEIHMATCHGSLYQTDNFIKYLGKSNVELINVDYPQKEKNSNKHA